jgi:hypothetical protein
MYNLKQRTRNNACAGEARIRIQMRHVKGDEWASHYLSLKEDLSMLLYVSVCPV